MKTAAMFLGLMVLTATSSFNTCAAQQYDRVESAKVAENEIIYAWQDIQQKRDECDIARRRVRNAQMILHKNACSLPFVAQAAPAQAAQTSRRTNTNLSACLPPTVTCSVSVNILDDRDYSREYAAEIPPETLSSDEPPIPAHPLRGSVTESGF